MAQPDGPQGYITFPGIQDTEMHGSITVSHGVTPSVATVHIAPQAGFIPDYGTLRFVYGNVMLEWRECKVDSMNVDIPEGGTEIWTLHIFDRRWKWKGFGNISGYYNSKISKTSDKIIHGRKKSARELAELCLRALNERQWDVRAMPTDSFPEVEWDNRKPAEALSDLVDQYGCRVTLNRQGIVRIVELGRGRALLNDDTKVSAEATMKDTPEVPDKIIVKISPTLWQMDLELEAVGEEEDGEIKPINQLSYRPSGANGWRDIDIPHCNEISDTKLREIAQRCIFKWYRVKLPIEFPLGHGVGAREAVVRPGQLNRILPLRDHQLDVDPAKVATNPEKLRAWVYGRFWLHTELGTNNRTTMPAPDSVTAKTDTGFYPHNFQIDAERGIVIFDEPVYMGVGPRNNPGEKIGQAMLRLRVAVGLRHPETYEWHQYGRERTSRGKLRRTPPRVDVHNDFGLEVIVRYNRIFLPRTKETNQQECDDMANHYLDAINLEYRTRRPATRVYAGFVPLELDGIIQQITWEVDGQGFARTRASAEREEYHFSPPYTQKRHLEKMSQLVGDGKNPAPEKSEHTFTASRSGGYSSSFSAVRP